MSATNYTTKHINAGDLFVNLQDRGLTAFKHDDPYRSEFRMNSEYVFTIIDDECLELSKKFKRKPWTVKVLMANTGKFQLVHVVELDAYIQAQLVKKIE